MGQAIPSTEQLTEAYMRLALMRWIDQLPKEELEAEFARLPAGEEKTTDDTDYDKLWEQFPPAPEDGSLVLEGTMDYSAPTDENYARMAADEERERNRVKDHEEDEWAHFRGKTITVDNPYRGDTEIDPELDAAYAAMAADKEREREALEWIEGTLHPNDL